MENFWNDLLDQVSAYYQSIVALMPKLVLGIIIILVFWYLSSLFKRWSGKWLRLRMDDPLLAVFLSRLVKATFLTIGLLAFLQVVGLGKAAGSLLAGAGISAFVIGFAFKDIGENFLAGILMAFKRPFRIGDVIESGDIKGTIIGLSLRDTQVKTFDGKDVYIPNGMILKNPIINYTIDGFLRQMSFLFLGILFYEILLLSQNNIINKNCLGFIFFNNKNISNVNFIFIC